MRTIETITADCYEQLETAELQPKFSQADYEARLKLLLERMAENHLSHVVVYGDKEHFSNMWYLIGHDPRFEEALLVVSADRELTLIVGNEGYAHSFQSPLPLNRRIYQNFSLQGQPRDSLVSLSSLLRDCGLSSTSRVGVIGFKYFQTAHIEDAPHRLDLPAYVAEELYEVTPREQVVNYTAVMTHCDSGLRMTLRSAKEIAYYEYACQRSSACVIRMLRALRPGVSELELTQAGGFDGAPLIMHPFVSFGDAHVNIGLRSPDENRLAIGDLIMVCYGIRGSLVCKSGLAIRSESDLTPAARDCLETFYQPFFRAITLWYEALSVGASCGEIYRQVMEIIGDRDRFHVELNPGHNIGDDEWTNSPFYADSPSLLQSGCYLQSDMIASRPVPHLQAILEDGVIVADAALRRELEQEYPGTFRRIQRRRDFLRDVVGIRLHEDVLPLSDCQGLLHPFLLDLSKIFAWR